MKMADSLRSAAEYHSKLKVPMKVSKKAWYDDKMNDDVYQVRSDLHNGFSKAEMQSRIGEIMRNDPDMMFYTESIAHALNSFSPERRAELLKKYPASASRYYRYRGFGRHDKDLLDVLNGVTNIKNPNGSVAADKASFVGLSPEQKQIQIEKLQKAESIKIHGDEVPLGITPKETRKNAQNAGMVIRGQYRNDDTGRMINVSRKSILETLEHDASDMAHVQSIAAIPEIIKKSVYVDSRVNEDIAKHPNVKQYDYFLSGLNVGKTPYTVKAVIAQDSDGNRYYDHKLSKIEKGKLFTAPAPDNESGGSKKLAFIGEYDKRLSDILQGAKSNTKSSSRAIEIVRRALEPNSGSGIDWAERFGKQNAAYRKAYVHEGKARFGQSKER